MSFQCRIIISQTACRERRAPESRLVVCIKIIILNTKSIIFNTKSILFNTKSIIFDTNRYLAARPEKPRPKHGTSGYCSSSYDTAHTYSREYVRII